MKFFSPKISFLKLVAFLLFATAVFFVFWNYAKADVLFANVGSGSTSDDGTTVTDPTIFNLETPVHTRYLRIEARNDGSQRNPDYIELRAVKAWAGGSTNVLQGIYSGGRAQVVDIDGYNGASPWAANLTYDCSYEWFPQGTLCDEDPNANSKTVSSKSQYNSGATWDNGASECGEGDGDICADVSSDDTAADSTGVLVIDMGSAKDLTELAVFQMFADGKTTQIRFASHPETGDNPPAWDDSGWTDFTDNSNSSQNSSNNSQENGDTPDIHNWSAYKYQDNSSCQERLDLTVEGHKFDKDADVYIGQADASKVSRKSSQKLIAAFCLSKLIDNKANHTKNIYVQNPNGDKVRADDQIDLDNISGQSNTNSSSGKFSAGDFDRNTEQGTINIQTVLNKLGYLDKENITGYFGPITTDAIKKFQADNGLPATGFVGPLTMEKLSQK